MKILCITNDIDSGGAAKSLFVLAREACLLGHAVHLVSLTAPTNTCSRVRELAELGVEVSIIPLPYYPMSLVSCPIPFWKNAVRALARFGTFRDLTRLVADLRPDIIHYNSFTTLLAALPLAGYPAMLHAREVLLENAPLLGPTRQLLKRRIAEYVAISPVEAEQVERLFAAKATTVFNAPLDEPAYLPPPREGKLVYGIFAHISPSKGHLWCVHACASVARELRAAGVRLRMFGARISIHAALCEQIEADIARLGVGDIVTMEGYTDSPEEQLRDIHLLVRPDRSGSPWGRDIIEAMSLGRPVLSTGSRTTFIKPGETGMLVPVNDQQGFARALVQMADRALLERMGRQAHAFAAAHFQPRANAERVLECMERVVREAPKARQPAASSSK